MIGGCSWPAISTPISSLVVKSIGPTMWSRPRSRLSARLDDLSARGHDVLDHGDPASCDLGALGEATLSKYSSLTVPECSRSSSVRRARS
jgi:hypothetical protein